jgi:hypothetical protein
MQHSWGVEIDPLVKGMINEITECFTHSQLLQNMDAKLLGNSSKN